MSQRRTKNAWRGTFPKLCEMERMVNDFRLWQSAYVKRLRRCVVCVDTTMRDNKTKPNMNRNVCTIQIIFTRIELNIEYDEIY